MHRHRVWSGPVWSGLVCYAATSVLELLFTYLNIASRSWGSEHQHEGSNDEEGPETGDWSSRGPGTRKRTERGSLRSKIVLNGNGSSFQGKGKTTRQRKRKTKDRRERKKNTKQNHQGAVRHLPRVDGGRGRYVTCRHGMDGLRLSQNSAAYG